jgi:hypothetical protein
MVFALSGGMTAQERQAQALQSMDASDDAYCRKKADSTVTYDQCRKNRIGRCWRLNAAGRRGASVDLTAAVHPNGVHEYTLGQRHQIDVSMRTTSGYADVSG